MNQSNRSNNQLIGWSAAIASVLIGVGWQLSTRAAAIGLLAPVDLMLIRYLTPALLLLPVLATHGFWPKPQNQVGTTQFVLLLAFGGLVYGVFSYTGAKYAPVAHMGALVPGTIPLFVTLLAWLWFKDRPSPHTLVGLGVLFVGVLLVSTGGQWQQASPATLFGDVLFLIAALNWAVYTVANRGSAFTPLHLVALVAFWNAPFAVLMWLAANDTRLVAAPLGFVAWQVLMQGVIAAIGGNFMFLVVLQRLGAVTAAGTGAAVPACVAVGGVWVLGEALNWPMAIGVALTVLGIWAVQVWAKRSN